MIFIDRGRRVDGQTIEPSTDWFHDAEAKTAEAIDDGPSHEVTDLYKHDQVTMALEALFHDKCAYCETPLGADGPWDVEHYRPKGRVAEREDHPGYYWLAYDWENLYPACQYCNQRRKDKPRWGDRRTLPAAGKLDQFPVVDEAHRAMSPDESINDELPLLLDPNVDDPELYFEYDLQGQISAIDDDPFAEETIRICHLTRRRLRKRRSIVVRRMVRIVRSLERARSLGDPGLVQELDDLLTESTADSAHYAAVARAVVRDPVAFGAA